MLNFRRRYDDIIDRHSRVLGTFCDGISDVRELTLSEESSSTVMIFVAAYVSSELRLLKDVAKKKRRLGQRVCVVDVLTCSQEDFNACIPGIGRVFQTPVVGIWEGGVLIEKASGYLAVLTIKRYFGVA